MPVIVSAATGLARNGIAARDMIASVKKSLDGVITFLQAKHGTGAKLKVLLSR